MVDDYGLDRWYIHLIFDVLYFKRYLKTKSCD